MTSILYITVDFPPYRTSGIYRPTRFSNRWTETGSRVTVVTVKKHLSEQTDDTMLRKLDSRVNVIRCRSPLPRKLTRRLYRKLKGPSPSAETASPEPAKEPSRAGSISFKHRIKRLLSRIYRFCEEMIYIPDEYVFWVPFAVWKGYFAMRREKCDIIFASSPPHSVQLVGMALKFLTGKKYVTDFRNSWTDNRVYNNRLARAIDMHLEKRSLKKADMIVTMSPGDRLRLMDYRGEYIKAEILPVTNGYAEEDFCDLPEPGKQPGRFNLVHLGTVYGESGKIFIDALKKYIDTRRPDPNMFRVEFAGTREAKLEDYVRKNDLESYIKFPGFINHDDVPAYLVKEADMLLVLTVGDRFFSPAVLPGKIFEYMRARKPILHIGQKGDTHDFLAASNLEIFIEHHQLDRLPEALDKYAGDSSPADGSSSVNIEAITRFEWNNLADRLMDGMERNFSR